MARFHARHGSTAVPSANPSQSQGDSDRPAQPFPRRSLPPRRYRHLHRPPRCRCTSRCGPSSRWSPQRSSCPSPPRSSHCRWSTCAGLATQGSPMPSHGPATSRPPPRLNRQPSRARSSPATTTRPTTTCTGPTAVEGLTRRSLGAGEERILTRGLTGLNGRLTGSRLHYDSPVSRHDGCSQYRMERDAHVRLTGNHGQRSGANMTNSVPQSEPVLPREVWQALLASGTVRRYDKGEVLMRQGDPGSHVLALTVGRVKVTRVDPDGNELVLAIRGPGELVGEMAVLGYTARSATVTALASCVTYMLASANFLRIVREKRVEGTLLRHVIARYRESEDARADLAGLTAMQRMAKVLFRFATVVNGEHPELDLSQEELAGATGLSRASVAAALATFRQQGLIVTGRRSLVISDLAKLRASAG